MGPKLELPSMSAYSPYLRCLSRIDRTDIKWQASGLTLFSNNCDTLNADVAFSPNVILNVKYMYNDWLSNIDESVKANVSLM